MLTILDVPHDNVLAVRIDGKIENDDMERMVEEMNRKFALLEDAGNPTKLRAYVEAVDFRGISVEALMTELKGVFPHINDFEKKAVVSDMDWVETVTKIFSPLTDWWIEGRHYRPENKDEALAWAAE